MKFNELIAYGQAVRGFVQRVFELAARVSTPKLLPALSDWVRRACDPSFLRKDYAYLFERFYHYLEAVSTDEMGLVVFDELEKAQSRILLGQLESIFWNPKKVISAARVSCPNRSLCIAT